MAFSHTSRFQMEPRSTPLSRRSKSTWQSSCPASGTGTASRAAITHDWLSRTVVLGMNGAGLELMDDAMASKQCGLRCLSDLLG